MQGTSSGRPGDAAAMLSRLPSAEYRDGRWWACFIDHQGRRRRVRTRACTRAEAQRMSAAYQGREDAARAALLARVGLGRRPKDAADAP
jgi:hypothetical protein